ncbi:ATP-binding cassette domain-containing protein [Thalassorhabdus alkalitolerans]|uniref:ATP-binding cassette domain-containing protein n=1 Tax=Thalassorhabdus alkalitolerans TaxID=2282697 RepID=A0ABW0YHB9_9BACI
MNQLTKSYGKEHAVRDVSFALENGRCTALLGPNGAGKTTILKMLSGLLKPTDGTIHFTKTKARKDNRKYIGFLPQHPVFYDWMTGREFLMYAGRLSHLSFNEAKFRADELLTRVGIEEAGNQRIGKYSGGMKQRLGIAQAMIHRPALLMLDEPVSALDPIGRREILQMMKDLKKETTLLFSTHILNDAEEVSDDVLILRKGLKVAEGNIHDLRTEQQKAKIHVQVKGMAADWLQEWRAWAQVEDIEFEDDLAKIRVNDLEQAKKLMLKKIVQQEIPLISFEVARTTLEDLFMEVVNQ